MILFLGKVANRQYQVFNELIIKRPFRLLAKRAFTCYYLSKINYVLGYKKKVNIFFDCCGGSTCRRLRAAMALFSTNPPTCSDGKQNQSERGIDCGGTCSLACKEDVSPLVIEWSRAFKVEDGTYDVVAFVENQNGTYGVEKAIYHFKIYDKDNILIAEKFGKTYVKEREKFAVFETGIKTGKRIPQRVFFEFAPDMSWEKVSAKSLNISTKDKVIIDIDSRPRLNVTIVNESFSPVKNLDIVAILYDINDNALSVSSTNISSMEKIHQKKYLLHGRSHSWLTRTE